MTGDASASRRRHAGLRTVLRYFFAQQRLRLWLGMLMAALTLLGGLALLGVAGWFITASAIAGLSAATAAAFNYFGPSSFIRFLAIERTVARYGERLVTHDATLSVLAALRERLFRGWAQPQAARRLLAQPARLLFRLTSDIDALDSLYLRVLVPAAAALFAVVAAGLALSWLSPWLGLALMAWLLVVGLGVPWWVGWRARQAARLAAYAVEALRARTIDLVAGQVELLMAGRLPAQAAALLHADAVSARADAAKLRLETRVTLAHGVATAVALAGTLLAGAALFRSAAIGAPMAAFAMLVVLAAFEPFTALRRGAVEFGRTLLAVDRVAPRIDGRTGAPAAAAAAAPPAGEVVHLAGVTYTYPGAGAAALAGVDLDLRTGERVALVGASGAGKSTLLALVAGEIVPQGGRIEVARHCMLTQRTELFQDSVRGNLLLADPQAGDEALWQALDDAGLGDTVRAMAGGLDARLGEGGLGLSGGQARRLALARLLLRKAPLWLLDEPTEGLDGATAADVLARLGRRGQGQAMLVATHLRREADLADMLVVVADGRLQARHRRGEAGFGTVLASLRAG
jgi:ATP-binding cassette subfamily C protein CydC